MPAHITVVGSLNMDLVVRVPRMPMPGETIIGSDARTIPGGKGANQAVAAARLGAQVTMVGRVGDDGFGQTLWEGLGQEGIDATHVRQDPQAVTGLALIALDNSGQNQIIVAPGANARLSPPDIEAAAPALNNADILVCQLETPLQTVTRAIELAHARQIGVLLNPAPAQPLPPELLRQIDYLIPNESESTVLAGFQITGLPSAEKAAASLLAQGVGTVIITLGARGALLATPENTVHIPAYEVTVVDTTAAGDAFIGGFAVARAEGRPLEEAVRFGSAAGALAVTRLGAQPSLPRRSEVEYLTKERG